jgi:hypothetical protein
LRDFALEVKPPGAAGTGTAKSAVSRIARTDFAAFFTKPPLVRDFPETLRDEYLPHPVLTVNLHSQPVF